MNPVLLAKLEAYGAGLLVVLVVGFGLYWKGHIDGAERVQLKFDAFVSETKALGDKARADALKKESDDKLAKGKADEQNRMVIATLTSTISGLRQQRASAGGGQLPAAPAGAKRPDLICFDRQAYQSAYGGLVTEVRGLADEGTASTVNLDTAKLWAQARPTVDASKPDTRNFIQKLFNK